MAILLTGGTGFVGLNIVEALLRAGRDVVVLDTGPVPPAAEAEFAALPGRLCHVAGDVRDPASFERAFAAAPIDALIHAAAVTAGSEREGSDPAIIAEVNLLGTIRALTAAHGAGVSRVVVLSTGSVYGEAGQAEEGVLDEAVQRPVPNNLYGISKYAAERSSLRLAELWGLDLRVGRPAVVFGCWERETGYRDGMSLVLQATRAAERGEAVAIAAQGPEDWIYAPDLAASVIALLDAETPLRRVYNLGTGQTWPLSAWCERLRIAFPGFSYRVAATQKEATLSVLSASSIRAPFRAAAVRDELSFVPQYDLAHAFDHYIEWRRAHRTIG